ncbi:MAG: hypothetical protein CVU39_20015 [Chloroflexi bacterium HGW-Chloroflexi-10]|nr:MAG: hypothetical protein CVU39_20015 [Chloroflexi bacterium HGW-Chloroflexi-10]
MKKTINPVNCIFIFLGIVAVVGFIAITALFLVNGLRPDPEIWRNETTPLPKEVLTDLCQKFTGETSSRLCNSDKAIFAPHFFPIIEGAFPVGYSTFDEVEAKLGNYQKQKSEMITLGNEEKYFRVWYDLRGDDKTTIIFHFSENGLVRRVVQYLGDDE